MSTEQKKRAEDEPPVVEVEEKIEDMEEKDDAFELPDFEYGGDCCIHYDDDCDSSDGDDDYDDEPKPKAEPELWVFRKYNKDCVNDRFRDYFMLDRGHDDFVIPFSSAMGLPSYHVYDDSDPSASDGGSYLSAIVDGGPDAVLPPCLLPLESATTSTSASAS